MFDFPEDGVCPHCRELIGTIPTLKAQLEQASAEIKHTGLDFQEDILALKFEKAALQDQIKDLAKQLAQTQDDLSSLSDKNTQLQGIIHSLQQEHVELITTLRDPGLSSMETLRSLYRRFSLKDKIDAPATGISTQEKQAQVVNVVA